jgi:hypothetical protein
LLRHARLRRPRRQNRCDRSEAARRVDAYFFGRHNVLTSRTGRIKSEDLIDLFFQTEKAKSHYLLRIHVS